MCKCYPGCPDIEASTPKRDISRERAKRIPGKIPPTTVAGRAHMQTDPMPHMCSQAAVWGSLD